jgi:hypothetical protein
MRTQGERQIIACEAAKEFSKVTMLDLVRSVLSLCHAVVITSHLCVRR